MQTDLMEAADLIVAGIGDDPIDQRMAESYREAVKRGDMGQAAECLYNLRLRRRLRNPAEIKRYFEWLGTPESQADPQSRLTYLDRYPEEIDG